MKRFFLLSLSLLLAIPAFAQDDDAPETPTVMVSFHQCDMSGLETLVEQSRERMGPIAQALVDEGALLQVGMAVHQWGDEYNVMTWYAGDDMASATEGWDEAGRRYNAAHPDDRLFIETCPSHRDYSYTAQSFTRNPDAPSLDEDNPPTLALSHYRCEYPAIGEIIENYRERAQPIAQSVVDEGKLMGRGLYTHNWGDEWNVMVAVSGEDLPNVLDGIQAFADGYAAAHGEDARNPIQEHCSAHKDNIYWVVMRTDNPN